MKLFNYLFLIFIAFTGCRDKYHRTSTGLLFKVIKNTSDTIPRIAKIGSVAKLHYLQKAGDTIIESTYDVMPLYFTVTPGFANKYNPLEVFDYGLREGDSIVTIQRVDSMMKKKIFEKLPSYLKEDDEWYTYMKVVKMFDNDGSLYADQANERRRVDSLQAILGIRRIENYLRINNINFTKSDSGVYVQTIKPGTGINIDTGKTVALKYNFAGMRGNVFDGNTDTTFHRPDTLSFKIGSGFMLKSVEDGLRLLKPGTHAKLYIPTMKAFGGTSQSKNLKPYEDVVFEVWVLGVNDKK